ncbi:egg cell-secreted protein 1.2-like [Salvia splendens]|uniref:egg cell-secreted protein 1.2-like n=1 Tax=Salvia splendens TaxID=180675 RepID=UPI001103FD16|nr:egg cell-secreted protein 1.2-like [Salvia splendens]
MTFIAKLIAVLLAAIIASPLAISTRKVKWGSSLAVRLRVAEEEGPSTCWEALSELHSCMGEVVMFFLNGETALGASCCNAIRVIEHQCWPSMLGTLDITTQEGDVLRGYCDAATNGGGGAAPPPRASTVEQCYSFPRLQH